MTIEQNLTEVLDLFIQGKTGNKGNFYAVKNAVVFRDMVDRGNFSIVQEILVIRTNSGVLLGNSSRLPNLENHRLKNRVDASTVQNILSEKIPMIPFTVFQEAGLDLMTCEIVDAGPAETLKEIRRGQWNYNKNEKDDDREIPRHYTGARLFKAFPKIEATFSKNKVSLSRLIEPKFFLCDVDRREINHGIINFFLAELPEKCGSISEAYEMLKPEEVKTFEKNTGSTVERQGEFFFIPTRIDPQVMEYNQVGDVEKIDRIRVGNSRPNTVERGYKVNNEFIVTGTISHTGREHADLKLNTDSWFKVVPNTSKANFQLTGDID